MFITITTIGARNSTVNRNSSNGMRHREESELQFIFIFKFLFYTKRAYTKYEIKLKLSIVYINICTRFCLSSPQNFVNFDNLEFDLILIAFIGKRKKILYYIIDLFQTVELNILIRNKLIMPMYRFEKFTKNFLSLHSYTIINFTSFIQIYFLHPEE